METMYLSDLFTSTLKGKSDIKSIIKALQKCDAELYRRIGHIHSTTELSVDFFGSSNFKDMKPGKLYDELSQFWDTFKVYEKPTKPFRLSQYPEDMYIIQVIHEVSRIYEDWKYEKMKSFIPKGVIQKHEELIECIRQIPNKTDIKFMTSGEKGMKIAASFQIDNPDAYTQAAVRRLLLEWISSVGVAAILAKDLEQDGCIIYGIWFTDGKWRSCSDWAIKPIVDRIMEDENIHSLNKIRFMKLTN